MVSQRLPDPPLEFGADHVEVEIEVHQFAGEVRLELGDGVGECPVVADPAGPVGLVGLVDHPQVPQPAVYAGQRQRTHGAVDSA